MSRQIEIPIKVCECRRELNIGMNLMAAVLRKLGISNAKRVQKSRITKFLVDNPTFKITDVYPRKKTQAAQPTHSAS